MLLPCVAGVDETMTQKLRAPDMKETADSYSRLNYNKGLHYRNRAFCRVSGTLGKRFAECYTRQRGVGTVFVGEGLFAECLTLGTRQSICRVP
jgi:hypothetical protein